MRRGPFLLLLLLGCFLAVSLWAEEDEGPAVSIMSPDRATTFVYGSIKARALVWNKKEHVLIARVTFTDAEQSNGSSNDDTHDFKLPGVTFDEAKGIFSVTTRKGVVIPVAQVKKALFFKSIEVAPNAAIRVLRKKGDVTVILEAVSPDDPALHPPPADADGTHRVDADKVMPGL